MTSDPLFPFYTSVLFQEVQSINNIHLNSHLSTSAEKQMLHQYYCITFIYYIIIVTIIILSVPKNESVPQYSRHCIKHRS